MKNDFNAGGVFLLIFIFLLALAMLCVGLYYMDDSQDDMCKRNYGGPMEAAHCRKVLANDRE